MKTWLLSGLARRMNSTALELRLLDLAVVLFPAWLIASLLGVGFLWSRNLPTGGDTASHLLYAWTYAHELLPEGYVTAWMPEVFAGFPFLSYYFPLSFISIAGLAVVLPFAPAMKLGMFAAAMALPGAVWLGSVYWLRLPRVVAIWGVLTSLAFLLHEQNSIWGGNLLSTLSGEFAYSYGILFATLTLFAWQRTMATGRYWWLAAVMEAATGFSHGFALLITGFATAAFLFDRRRFFRNLRLLGLGHGLAFLMLAGWLWPMMEMHGITIPNDALFEVKNWQDLLPKPMQPVLLAGLTAALLMILIQTTPVLKRFLPSSPELGRSCRHAAFMAGVAMLAGVGFLAGSRLGFANIRFFPFVWLFGGLACAWVWGCLLLRLAAVLPALSKWGVVLLASAGAFAFAAWVGLQIVAVPDWGLWNHSGLEAKPQWNLLTRLFPALAGNLASPRLLFEHDPANNDLGSTRSLEALPMFLGGRPVLEGLYMESALVSPSVYQMQSEVSARPSSPLARFPSGSLDLGLAAAHMNFMYANDVLVRSEAAHQAFAADTNFEELAQAAPFYVFRLKGFNTHMVDLVDRPIRWMSKTNWMEASFQWFRSGQRFSSELLAFYDGTAPSSLPTATGARVQNIQLDRHRISWRTDAIGAAHLVRMAWHPRWRLITKGTLHMAGPGFMLVIPDEADVELVYGQTPIGIAGMVATLLGIFLLTLLVWRDLRPSRISAGASVANRAKVQIEHWLPWPRDLLAILWPAMLVGLGFWLYLHDPEHLYTDAWKFMRSNLWSEAAEGFDRAYVARQSDAKKEEALFWAAKAQEQAGSRDEALKRYRQLAGTYHGYWLAESLYTQWQLAQASGLKTEAQAARERLLLEFPNSRWAQRLPKDQ